MTVAAVTSVVARPSLIPGLGQNAYVITYSKANVGDTLDVVAYGIKTIVFAEARDDSAGADDPVTWSGTTISFSAGTGAGRVLVIGES